MSALQEIIRKLPKAELHVHLEGTIEPEMLFRLAKRNRIAVPWDSPESLRNAYRFQNLSGFLDIYFKGCEVMRTAADFHDVTKAYLERAVADNVRHAEVFLGPQSFLAKGIPLNDILSGIFAAIEEMKDRISCYYLPSVLRTRTEREALNLLDRLAPWHDRIAGFGMGGAERDNPPSGFSAYFSACKKAGFKTTVHAGEEGPASYVREALDILHVDRIDHGNSAQTEPDLIDRLARSQTPLTMCPVSNLKLNVISDPAEHPLKRMLDAGVCVTVNSDDPGYFQAYVAENWRVCAGALHLSVGDIRKLAENSFQASFLPQAEKRKMMAEVAALFA